MKRKRFRFLFPLHVLVVLLFASVSSAQIRFYDPANDELAKKTRDAFTEFSKGDANVFETMVSNTLNLKEATLAHLYELNQQSTRDTANLIPLLTWTDLRKDVRRTQQEFREAYDSARTILNAGPGTTDLKETLAAAKADLATLQRARAQKEAELKNEAPDLTKLKDSLENLKNALAASQTPVRSLSDLGKTFTNLKLIWTNVASVKKFWDETEKYTQAPGLQLTILDSAVAHRQAKVDRLKLEVEEAKAVETRAQRIEQRLELVWNQGDVDANGEAIGGLFGQVYAGIKGVSNPDERVLETIGKLAKQARNEVGTSLTATIQLRDLLDILGRYVSLAGYQKYLLLSDAIESGVDHHLFSIRRSALNTNEREVLVGYGLDGLAAYHEGGLRPEQIANFFRAVQAIAVGVLAGKE
jgi:DNA repair exonuclease SbcCD ATPase subunit